MAHLKIMAAAATVWAPGSPSIVGSSCRKRRTVIKSLLPRGQGRAARPPFEDPRVPSTVPRRSWRGSQRRQFWRSRSTCFFVYILIHFWTPFLVPARAPPLSKIRSKSNVFWGPVANWPRWFWQLKTCNSSKIYCPAAFETGPKTGGMEERLFWESLYFPVLWDPLKKHVFRDVVRTCFGSHFRDLSGDPVWMPFGCR